MYKCITSTLPIYAVVHARHRYLCVYVRATVCVCTVMNVMLFSTALHTYGIISTVVYSNFGTVVKLKRLVYLTTDTR